MDTATQPNSTAFDEMIVTRLQRKTYSHAAFKLKKPKRSTNMQKKVQ